MKHLEEFNKYLADLSVWTMKLHNMHWNAYGEQFMPVHKLTEEEYEKSFERMDAIAEHIRMFGALPAANLKEQLALAHIQEEESRMFKDKEILEIVLKDLETLRKVATDLRNACDKENLFTAVALLEDHCTDYAKQIWFLKSMLEA